MTTKPTKTCPHCGKPVQAQAFRGVCPECLLKVGLGTAAGADPGAEAPPAPRFRPPGVAELTALFPQLEILELLGQGGMGAVYRARQRGLERMVALKILPPDAAGDPAFTERFMREARALARLSHPHIVGVHDFGCAGGYHYLLMEYIDGSNLRQMLRSGGLAPKEAMAIVPQICEALQSAHDEGVVHRDIKPENILVDRRGRVKIADFGLARILGGSATEDRLTRSQDVMGTPHYMAPEQVEHPLAVDHRADIYSLGVVFYEMLTGELPLGRFKPPSQKVMMDVRLDEVVLRTLEKEPELRFQRVADVKTRVETIAADPGGRPVIKPAGAGFEYRSKATVFGLPLVHVSSGRDPVTGRPRVARGIVAIGGVAQGMVAFGGVAMGGFTVGGLSLGVFSFGGCALGGVAFGGLAVALLVAFGGMALSPLLAMGGGGVGYYALGGGAWCVQRIDPGMLGEVGHAFVEGLPKGEGGVVPVLLGIGLLGLLLLAVLGLLRRAGPTSALPGPAKGQPSARRRASLLIVGGLSLPVVFGVGLLAFLTIVPHQGAGVEITGRVVDAVSGEPIENARVADVVYDAGPRRSPRATWTDGDGRFWLNTVYEEHTLVASAPGYTDQVQTLMTKVVGREVEVTMDFRLTPAPGLVAVTGAASSNAPPTVAPAGEKRFPDFSWGFESSTNH